MYTGSGIRACEPFTKFIFGIDGYRKGWYDKAMKVTGYFTGYKSEGKTRKQEEMFMKRKIVARVMALGLSTVLMTTALAGCRFGFASDPDERKKRCPLIHRWIHFLMILHWKGPALPC